MVLSDQDENGPYDALNNRGSQINLASIQVAVVHEPGALALGGLGIALQAWRRHQLWRGA